jgi:hypothetical protein
MHPRHENPYPPANGLTSYRLNEHERRIERLEEEVKPIALLGDRMTALIQRLEKLESSTIWLTRVLIGSSGVLAVAAALLVKYGGG